MSLVNARIVGVNIPVNKKLPFSLCYIFGIGRNNALDIIKKCNLDPEKRVKELTEEEINKIRKTIENDYIIEGSLRSQIASNIKIKISINCFEGSRHRNRLPLHGRTRTNARTRKGKRVTVANKKIVAK